MPRRPDPLRVASAQCNGLAYAYAHSRITEQEALAEIRRVKMFDRTEHVRPTAEQQWILDDAAGLFINQATAADSLALALLMQAGADVDRARALYEQLHAGPGGVMGLGDQR